MKFTVQRNSLLGHEVILTVKLLEPSKNPSIASVISLAEIIPFPFESASSKFSGILESTA